MFLIIGLELNEKHWDGYGTLKVDKPGNSNWVLNPNLRLRSTTNQFLFQIASSFGHKP